MIKTICAVSFLLLSLSCKEDGNEASAVENKIQEITGRDSVVTAEKQPGSIDYSLTGFYQSSMPCRTCDGSQQTLLLKEDASYKLHDLPAVEGHKPMTHQGVWSFESGQIVLFENNVVVAKYRPKGDTLLTVQRQGTVLSDSASRAHHLNRRRNAAQYLPYRKMLEEGLLVYGIGTEPFWNLKIDSARVEFRLADWKKAKIFELPVFTYNADTVNISLSGDSLMIQIFPEFCNDGMSDFLFEHRLLVKSLGGLYQGCAVLSKSKISK